MEICSNAECSGCGMCTNICPGDAITMKRDEHGFYAPVIDVEKCVSCGLCRERCPVNSRTDREPSVRNVYAAWNRDSGTRRGSTSGGIFSLFAEAVISQGGYVFGVKWHDRADYVEHVGTNEKDKIVFFRGAKYLPSHTGTVYREIRKLLEDGRSVLFSGTPCQNHALQVFLNREYENLYCIDTICHGIPSESLYERFLGSITDQNDAVRSVRFRDKTPYWDYGNITVMFEKGKKYSVPTVDDPFYILFNIGHSLRASCHRCRYASLHRYGDVTLADFWGFEPNNFKMGNYYKGLSCILINSEKGEKMWDAIKDRLVYEESTVELAVRGNKCLKEPFSLPDEETDRFWKDYEEGKSVKELREKYVPDPFKAPPHIHIYHARQRFRWIFRKLLGK